MIDKSGPDKIHEVILVLKGLLLSYTWKSDKKNYSVTCVSPYQPLIIVNRQ